MGYFSEPDAALYKDAGGLTQEEMDEIHELLNDIYEHRPDYVDYAVREEQPPQTARTGPAGAEAGTHRARAAAGALPEGPGAGTAAGAETGAGTDSTAGTEAGTRAETTGSPET